MPDERAASDVDRRLGQRVRARRLELGMGQERLAGLLGITFQQVQKYEKGLNRIAASRLLDIAAALDVTPARFFDGLVAGKANRNAIRGESEESALATPEGRQIITSFALIKDRELRKRVVELVRVVASENSD